jgi:cation diffusion facilitator CzcD-associated flavoprotein CzcO
MFDWIIVGAGPHGLHLAVSLHHRGGVARERIAIVDDQPEPLARWTERARAVGMQHMRSPSVHHIGLEPESLLAFARRWPPRPGEPERFTEPYLRPSLELFAAHSAEVIARERLRERIVQGRVTQVRTTPTAVAVDTTAGQLHARAVVLAIGPTPRGRWPEWATQIRASTPAGIVHALEPGAPAVIERLAGRRVAVIGAGVSAVQVAVHLHELGADVLALRPHKLKRADFDADPGWLGPRYLRAFQAEPDMAVRRAQITRARLTGTVPRDAWQQDRLKRRGGRYTPLIGSVSRVEPAPGPGGGWRLHIGLRRRDVDAVVLATGLEPGAPTGGGFVPELAAREGLRLAACGHPIVDAALRWGPRIHAVGALGELELGPSARNLSGARQAALRLSRFAATA